MSKLTPELFDGIRARNDAWKAGRSPGHHAASDRAALLDHINHLATELEDVTAAYQLAARRHGTQEAVGAALRGDETEVHP